MRCQVWCRRTYPLPYYSVIAADTLRCNLDLWPCDLDLLALNICSVSPVTWWNSVPNLNAIEQSAAELLRLQCLTLWPWTCFKCCAWLWDNFHQVWPSTTYSYAWIIAFLMLICYVTLWPSFTCYQLTLKFRATSSVTWSRYLQNLSEIEESLAELLIICEFLYTLCHAVTLTFDLSTFNF